MKIAVPYDDGEIFQHFGRTERFMLYDTEDGKILNSQIVGTDGQGHCATAGLLSALHVDALICGGIGPGAQMALEQMGISCFAGVSGNTDDAVKAFLDGTLPYREDAPCDHTHKCL